MSTPLQPSGGPRDGRPPSVERSAAPVPPRRAAAAERARGHVWQFCKFAVVGGTGTVVNLAVLKLTLVVWGVFADTQPFAVELCASALAFCVAVGNNFLLNRLWTFRSSGPIHHEFGKFFLVSLAGLGLNSACFSVFRGHFALPVLISQLVAIACVLPFNFLANKLWSFRGS